MNRYKIALCIAVVGLLLGISGFALGVTGTVDYSFAFSLFSIGLLVGWVAYIFAGLGTALKMALSIAKFGWFILPFPFDLISVPFTILIALYVLLCLPIIPIVKVYRENSY